jgi:hypothetical protein
LFVPTNSYTLVLISLILTHLRDNKSVRNTCSMLNNSVRYPVADADL